MIGMYTCSPVSNAWSAPASRPLFLSLFLVSIPQLGGFFVICLRCCNGWAVRRGRCSPWVSASDISTLKYPLCCTSHHLIWVASMISPVLCFIFATVVDGWHSNSSACRCVLTKLWHAANVWLFLGGVGFCLLGPEMSSPGSQYRAGNFGASTDFS